jgi:hypothetical protein
VPEALDPDGFPAEAGRFAAELGLDWSVASVARVERLLRTDRTDAVVIGAGCYVGEVLRREVGGRWGPEGSLLGVGPLAETMPLAKARAGEDLVAYVADVLRYAGS